MKKSDARIISRKRLWKILEYIGEKGSKIDDYLLKKLNAPNLDQIKKRKLTYPKDLFPIKNAPLEWWYFTGHLKDNKNKKFGFEFCFFKVHPKIIRLIFIPLYFFRKKPYLILHSTITDKNNSRFYVKQDSGLIHNDRIKYEELDLKLKDNTIKFNKKFHIKGDLIDLELTPKKKLIKHFDDGFQITHKKSKSRAYYLSFTRLNAKGTINIEGKKYPVGGEAWFDHQKCNIIKNKSLQGWDWFSIMLDDGTELMFYIIRDKRGLNHENLGGTYIKKNSEIIKLKPNQIKISPIGKWESPNTGIIYPSNWEVNIPKLKIRLKVFPIVKNQEVDSIMSAGTSYWEGACNVEGTKNGKKVSGKSYVELVGYDNRIIQKIVKESIVE